MKLVQAKTTFLIFASSEMCLHELHKASTVVEMALSDHPGTLTALYALLSHSTVMKTALSIFPRT